MENRDATNILVIDDDANFRMEVMKLLEKASIPASSFESGNHAIRFMQDRPWTWVPKLIITDLVMDGVGGYQLIRRLSELYPNKNIPVIVVSRLSSPDYIYEAEVAGAQAFIAKPLQAEKLLSAIEKVLHPKA